jgi:glutamyl-Q tRNA(Asp) synthetase
VSDRPHRGPLLPDPGRLPQAPTTRFAPAPTGYLHLGHVVNAICTWGLARVAGGSVVLRIEDHDRQRCRPEYEAALLEDLEWLGFVADRPSLAELRSGPSAYRQSDDGVAYEAAVERLRAAGLVYPCDCTRSTFAAWAAERGHRWSGSGCPGGCADRGLAEGADLALRVRLGAGSERFDDLRLGSRQDPAAADGDLVVRDRHGNWTYHLCVVVDDDRHGVDLVVRGEDLLEATPRQLRLGRLLGRATPPAYLHHPLIRKASGAKLSKADGDTGVRELRAAGWTSERVVGEAAAAVGLVRPGMSLQASDAAGLVTER